MGSSTLNDQNWKNVFANAKMKHPTGKEVRYGQKKNRKKTPKKPHKIANLISKLNFYNTALKGCQGIAFTHGVRMGRRAGRKSLSSLYLRNDKVEEVDTW